MFACIYIGELFAADEVAFIMALGALLEDYVVARAKRGVNKLLSLAPDEARLIDNGARAHGECQEHHSGRCGARIAGREDYSGW